MNNYRLSKRPRPHHGDDGRPAKRPRWKHQDPRPNYKYNQNFNNSGRQEHPSYTRPWPTARRGSFNPHQTPCPRPFYQAPHQQQFFPGHSNYSQFRGPPPMYNNQQQQSSSWNASFPPSNRFPWRQSHQPPASREADYNPSDSSASSSPSHASTSKTDAFPGYFTTAISQPSSSPPNSSSSGSTEYEPVFSTKITAKNRSVPSQSVVPIKSDAVHSKKNKVVEVLGILDPKLIQIVQYLSSFQREVQESCEGKGKEELREEVQLIPNENKRQEDVNENSPPKMNTKTFKSDRPECIRLLYQNKICSSCEGVFQDVGAHSCLREENYSEWYPRTDNWINGRAAVCDEIAED